MNIKKFNWLVLQNLNKFFRVSFFDEIYWKVRNCNGDWKDGQSYLQSVNHSHRQEILDIIGKKYNRGFSLLEVGCNSAPNLIAIQRAFPFTALSGVDINKKAIKEGQKNTQNIKLSVANADSLPFIDKSFDIVLLDAVLMYVGPDKILKVISEIKRVAREMIIIVDFHDNVGVDGKIDEKLGHWVRDYEAIFKDYKTEIKKIDRKLWDSWNWSRLGHFITIYLNEKKGT